MSLGLSESTERSFRAILQGEEDLPSSPDDVMAIQVSARALLEKVQDIDGLPESREDRVRIMASLIQKEIQRRLNKQASTEQPREDSDAKVLALDNILRVFGANLGKLDDSSIHKWLENREAAAIFTVLRRRHGTNSAAMGVIRELVARNTLSTKMPEKDELKTLRSKAVALEVLTQLTRVKKFNPESKKHRVKFAERMGEEKWPIRLQAFFQNIGVRVKGREISFDQILVAHGWKIDSRREGSEALCHAAGFSYQQALDEASEDRAAIREAQRMEAGEKGRETFKERAARVSEDALKPSIVAAALSRLFGSRVILPPRDQRWRKLYAKMKKVGRITVTDLEKKRVTLPGLPTRQWLVIFHAWSGEGQQGSAWGFYRILTEVCGIPPKDIQKLEWRAGHHKDPVIIREALRQAFGLLEDIKWHDQRTKERLRTLFCKERPGAIPKAVFEKPITPNPMLLPITLGHMSRVHGKCDQPGKHTGLDIGGYQKMLNIVGI